MQGSTLVIPAKAGIWCLPLRDSRFRGNDSLLWSGTWPIAHNQFTGARSD